jgi:hypothetical protein
MSNVSTAQICGKMQMRKRTSFSISWRRLKTSSTRAKVHIKAPIREVATGRRWCLKWKILVKDGRLLPVVRREPVDALKN